MTRRQAAVATATLLSIVLVALMFVLPVPYVIEQPGPVLDTLGTVNAGGTPVVQISGTQTYSPSGHIYLTTVEELPGDCNKHPSLANTLRAWFNSDDAVIPEQAVCPPSQSAGNVVLTDQSDMTQSQSNAEIAALSLLGYKVDHHDVLVGGVEPGSPAAQANPPLQPRDVLLSVDGTTITSAKQVGQLVRANPPGHRVTVRFRRGTQVKQTTITTAAAPTSKGGTDRHVAFIGIEVTSRPVFKGVTVNIGINPSDVGGPSAGTALALGIIDKLTPGGITGGKTVAGTGAITASGRIQEIGGIQQKVAAAVAKGATVFFAPAANCADAKAQAPKSLTLIRATTLREVVDALKQVRTGSSNFPHC